MKKQIASELEFKILTLIQKGVYEPCPDEIFNELSLDLFRYQYQNNRPYERYCDKVRTKPNKIKHWKDIPSLPTSAFKEALLCCFPPQKAAKIFLTSGTTLKKQGKHYLENLTLYEQSLLVNFKAHFNIGKKRYPLLILAPSHREAPHSSLCHMLAILQKEIGTEERPYYIQGGRFLIEQLKKRLESFESKQYPIILLGTAFSFVHFLDDAAKKKWHCKLARGSVIMETGGYKGKSRDLPRQELYKMITKILGVPQTHIINEYGMAEMGSQFYDNSLKNLNEGRKAPRYKTIPPWVRTRILDPITLKELPPGEMGLLQHYDLTNRSSVMALLTEDVGIKIKDGFEILGRAPLAEPRGCSLGVEEWISTRSNVKNQNAK